MIAAIRSYLIINWTYKVSLSYIRHTKHMAACPALYFLRIADDCFHRDAEVVVRTSEWYRTVPEGSSQQPCRYSSQGQVMLGDNRPSFPTLSDVNLIGFPCH